MSSSDKENFLYYYNNIFYDNSFYDDYLDNNIIDSYYIKNISKNEYKETLSNKELDNIIEQLDIKLNNPKLTLLSKVLNMRFLDSVYEFIKNKYNKENDKTKFTKIEIYEI